MSTTSTTGGGYRYAVPHENLRILLKEVAGEGEELAQHVIVEVLKHVDEAEGRT